MLALNSHRIRTILIAVAVLELIIIVGAMGPFPLNQMTKPGAVTVAPLTVAALPELKISELSAFGEMIARPLFVAARRLSPAAQASAQPSFPPGEGVFLGHYRLNGIVFAPKLSIAFVTDLNTKKNLAIREGEKLGEWTLTGIAKERITLKRGQAEESFALPRAPQARPAR